MTSNPRNSARPSNSLICNRCCHLCLWEKISPTDVASKSFVFRDFEEGWVRLVMRTPHLIFLMGANWNHFICTRHLYMTKNFNDLLKNFNRKPKNLQGKIIKNKNQYLNNYFNYLFSFSAEYIKQCHKSDPELTNCLKGSLHHLKPYLAAGIPEIEVTS